MMGHKTSVLLAVAILLGLLGCNAGKKPIASTDEKPKAPAVSCPAMLIDADRYQTVSDPFDFRRVTISGNCLEIDVQYGGGCGEEEFVLVWDDKVKKSDPPVATLKLLLKDEDRCKKLELASLTYDLSPLKKHLGSTGQIKVVLDGYDTLLRYKPEE